MGSRSFFQLIIFASISYTGMALANNNYSALLDLPLRELMEVQVSIATLSQQDVFETPSSVTVYTKRELKQMGISSLEHLLNFVPGVQTARSQQDGVINTPVFRGRGNQLGSSPHVLLMIDGRRINSPVVGGAFELELNNLDWVKQVEVIRGPGSALYGANAFHGVINLITDIQSGEVKARYGDLGLKEASLQFNQSVSDLQLGLYLHAYEDDGEEYSPFYTYFGQSEPTQDPYRRYTVATHLSYQAWTFSSYFTDAQLKDFVQGSSIGNGTNEYATTHNSFRIIYEGFKGQDWNLKINSEYMAYNGDFFLTVMPAEVARDLWWSDGSEIVAIGGNHLEWNYTLLSVEGYYAGLLNHRLSYGAEYRTEWVGLNPFHGNWQQDVMASSNGNLILPCDCISRGFWFRGERADFLPESERKIENLWLQDEWQIHDDLKATLGMRYDYYDDVGGQSSYRGALVYRYSEQTRFKLIMGDAFRAPTISETRALIASNFVGNPDLKPETIRTVDLVWQQALSRFNLVATWSRSTLKDSVVLELQDEEYQAGIFAFQPVNSDKLDLESIELEINTSLSKQMLLRAGFTRHLEYEVLGTAQDLAFFIVNYSAPTFNLNLNGYYHDKVLSRRADNLEFAEDIYLKDFWNLTLNLGYFVAEQTELFLRVENLLDDDFTTYTTANGGLEYGIPTRGRLVSAGLDWRF